MRILLLRTGWLATLSLGVSLTLAQPKIHAPQSLTIATGSVGGTFLPVGLNLADWLEHRLPNLTVQVDTTFGSVDNVRRLAGGSADLAIIGLSPLKKMLADHSRFQVEMFCILGTLYIDAEQYVINKGLVRAGSLLDLNGVLMYPGPHKSGGEIDTRLVLGALDIEPQYVFPLERTKGYAEAAEALAWEEFHAATFSGGVPIQAITDLFERFPDRFIILPFSRFQMNRFRHRDIDFIPVEIPAGSYPGIDEPIISVGSPNVLVAGPSLDLFMIERVKKVILEGMKEEGLGLRRPEFHPVMQGMTETLWNQPTLELGCVPEEKATN